MLAAVQASPGSLGVPLALLLVLGMLGLTPFVLPRLRSLRLREARDSTLTAGDAIALLPPPVTDGEAAGVTGGESGETLSAAATSDDVSMSGGSRIGGSGSVSSDAPTGSLEDAAGAAPISAPSGPPGDARPEAPLDAAPGDVNAETSADEEDAGAGEEQPGAGEPGG
jgi:hypothetical protein